MKTNTTRFIASLVVCLLQFSWTQSVTAQVTVTGEVTEQAANETLPGVNIVVQGTQQGTTTNNEGRYELEVPSLQDTLVFSFIGYQTQVVPIAGQTVINVVMTAQTLSGEEIVVVGYGTQQRKQITGSVTSVKEEDFVQGNVNSANELIQGKVPGLQIATRSGDPNDQATIRLRGINSFGENQEPLVVVDGIIGGRLENIDPNDIASIDVLKDASASAIYGTRGSAGVIVITTKSGEGAAGPGEDVSFSYNAYVTVEGIENKLDVLNAEEYRRLSQVSEFDAPDFGFNTDWFDEISQTGTNNVHSLALAGGSGNTNYRISANFRDRDGIQKKTGFQQIGGRLNITQWAFDQKLRIKGILATMNKDQRFGFSDAWKFAGIMNPTAPVREEGFENTAGFFEQPLFNYFNPVAIIETGKRTGESRFFNGSLRADYEFENLIPNLSVSAFYSLQTVNEIRRNFFSRNNKFLGGATAGSLGPGLAEQFLTDNSSELFESTVNYFADITAQLNFEGIAGYSYNDFVDEFLSVSGGDFITDKVGFDNLTFAQDFNQGEGTVSSFKSTSRIIGFFGRVNLNWDDTYFLNGSIRREGSSRFGIDKKWGTFWSYGAGIQVTNLVDIPFLDGLRVRGSAGKTGNNAPEAGLSQQQFAPQGNFFVGGQFIQSFGPVSNPNPFLKWEEKTEINIGIDIEAVDNRLRGSAEWFNSTVDDLIALVGVPVPPNEFPQTWKNVGELENSGFEFIVDFDAIRQRGTGLNWNTALTFSIFDETMLNKFVTEDVQFIASPGSPGLNNPDLIRVKEGEPIGQIWGPEFAGISSDGEWLFFDKNGNQVTFGELTPDDRTILGNGLPDFQFGWTNSLNYKNFDFNVFVRGVFGHQLANMFSLFYQAPKQITSYNVLKSAFDISDLKSDPRWSSFHVEDADFVRLQSASLGYTFPLHENSPFRRFRVYVSGNNLFTITGYSGIDPEVRHFDKNLSGRGTAAEGSGTQNGGILAPGIERRIEWFTARSFSFGINLDF